jgi:hypothetical protein
MEFESILVSKALPVIHAHRYDFSATMCLILSPAPSVLQEGSSDASDACVYTRESVCREAASFKRATRT